MNKYLKWGICLNVVFLSVNTLSVAPEFVKGVLLGISLVLIFMGIYSKNHDICKLRNYKKNMLNKCLKRSNFN